MQVRKIKDKSANAEKSRYDFFIRLFIQKLPFRKCTIRIIE